jgi:hypothetical protein
MAFLVSIAGAAGLLASVILRAWGMTAMWLRYGIAVLEAYAVFLGGLWLWVHAQRRSDRWREMRRVRGGVEDRPVGPSRDWAGPLDLTNFFGAEEAVLVVALLVAVASVLLVCVYVVVMAPSFLAELLLDGVLAAAVFGNLRRWDKHWLDGAVARTWKPVVWMTFCFVILGLLCQHLVPDAVTLGDIFRPRPPTAP